MMPPPSPSISRKICLMSRCLGASGILPSASLNSLYDSESLPLASSLRRARCAFPKVSQMNVANSLIPSEKSCDYLLLDVVACSAVVSLHLRIFETRCGFKKNTA